MAPISYNAINMADDDSNEPTKIEYIATERRAGSSSSSEGDAIREELANKKLAGFTEWDLVYKPVDNYENWSVYDPKAQFTPEEEKEAVRKIDLRIMSWVLVMFFALQLDRGNIGQAIAGGFLNDLDNVTTNDYNTGMLLFYLSFLLMELPSQLISKKLGPERWIPIQLILWSVVAMLQCKVYNKTSFFLTRMALGAMEGGFIPDTILYLSYYYTGKELPLRLSWFWCALTTTNIIGGFLGYGLLHAKAGGLVGWQFVFLIEGALTLLIGLISFFYLSPSVTQKNYFAKLFGWDHFFTHREQVIIVNRVLRDDPSKGDMHNREGLSVKEIWGVVSNPYLWPLWVAGLIIYTPTHPPQSYLTIILKQLGFSTFTTSLLTIPSNVVFIANLFAVTYASERINNKRLLLAGLQVIWPLIPLIALAVIRGDISKWSRYAILFVILCAPYAHPMLVALNSRNANTVRARTVSASAYNMSVQISSIIATFIYRKDDAPLYRRGNWILVGFAILGLVVLLSAFFFYRRENQRRDKIWNSWSEDERLDYLKTTKDAGNKRLDFRFAY